VALCAGYLTFTTGSITLRTNTKSERIVVKAKEFRTHRSLAMPAVLTISIPSSARNSLATAERMPCGIDFRGPAPTAAAFFPAAETPASLPAEPAETAFRGRLLRHGCVQLPADTKGTLPPPRCRICQRGVAYPCSGKSN
jgi:hypothetical protein